VAQPHDHLFRQTFADAEHAAALFATCLRPAVAAAFKWPTLVVRTAEFVDEHLHEHRTDEVYSVLSVVDDEHIFVLEHKAAHAPGAPLQVLRYQLQISEQRQSLGLPALPILPVLVHHGPKPWSGPTSLLQGRGGDLHRYTDVHLIVIDLARYDEAAILALGLTDRGTATVLFLQILRDAPPDEAWAMLQRWLPLVRRMRASRDGRRALGGLLTYALEVTEITRDQLAAYAGMVGTQTDKDTIMSTADKLRAEGRSEGRTEGRVEGRTEGRAEGRAEGRIEALMRLLNRRFGPLPDHVAARVRTGTPQELDDWTDRILTAPTLDALFAHG